MANEVQLEAETGAEQPRREWGLHNGVVVLVALGLVALSLVLDWVGRSGAFFSTFVDTLLSQMSLVLKLAAGTVIGMLVATRLLQVHVGPRGARRLALWGVVAMVLSALLHSSLYLVGAQLQEAGQPLIFAFLTISELITGSMAIGASMIALAFVGQLRD